ncbi:MAG: Ycf66 family protein, partial [Cyanobacteriota bacterium]
ARDYDVFFAAVGLLCGGILFFQGWRLDPILQFGQFLLAGTTVFFAYESVRLRGVTTEQARRSSFFEDDEPAPGPYRPRMGGGAWAEDRERFDEPQPLRRRIRSRAEADEEEADDFYRPRRPTSRAAIPERAASRPRDPEEWERSGPAQRQSEERFANPGREESPRRYGAPASSGSAPEFGARRRERDGGSEPRRGSRPTPASEPMPRSSRRGPAPSGAVGGSAAPTGPAAGVPQGSPIRGASRPAAEISDASYTPISSAPTSPPSAERSAGRGPDRPPGPPAPRPRDNSSRFDD